MKGAAARFGIQKGFKLCFSISCHRACGVRLSPARDGTSACAWAPALPRGRRERGCLKASQRESSGVSASTFLICTGPRDRAQAPENKLHCQRGALVGRKSRQRKMPRNPETLNLPRTPRSLPVFALQQPRGFPNGSLCSFLLWSRDKRDTEQPAFAPGA